MSSPTRKNLQKNILATVLYYDAMNYPLTAFEIWKYLINIENEKKDSTNKADNYCGLVDIIRELDEYNLKRFLKSRNGFYFWRGREELVEKRIRRGKISAGKIKKLRRVVWWLRLVPFVRLIGITGALAMKNAESDSDWDVLVVLKSGRIWTGRTLVTGLLQIVSKRRHGQKIKDRVCLNHFITESNLEIATKEIEPFFPASQFFFLFPVFDAGLFRKFQLRNSWIRDYKPNYYLNETKSPATIEDSEFSRQLRMFGEKMFDWQILENWLERWQLAKIGRNPKTKLPGSYIKATAGQLVFLPEPQGPEIVAAMRQRLKNF